MDQIQPREARAGSSLFESQLKLGLQESKEGDQVGYHVKEYTLPPHSKL